ncbi:MAG: hypothetical protein RID09_30255 [Coleofasciculus sp. G1-WW12-02]
MSKNQTRSLWDYYDLLVDCLRICNEVNPQVQQDIEDELFLDRE